MSEPLPIWQAIIFDDSTKVVASYYNPDLETRLEWIWVYYNHSKNRWTTAWGDVVHPTHFFTTNTEFYRWLVRQ